MKMKVRVKTVFLVLFGLVFSAHGRMSDEQITPEMQEWAFNQLLQVDRRAALDILEQRSRREAERTKAIKKELDSAARECELDRMQQNAARNRAIAAEQMRDWPRCLAQVSFGRTCGRYCNSRNSRYCYQHEDYVPLGEAFSGDRSFDDKVGAGIVKCAWRMAEAEEDVSIRTQMVKRISIAVKKCQDAYARGDKTARIEAAQGLWDVWHVEKANIPVRANERRAQWEREHPEEVAEMRAKASEALRRKAEAEQEQKKLKLAEMYSETSNRIYKVCECIWQWEFEYSQFGKPQNLGQLGFLLRGGSGTVDKWGRPFQYESAYDVVTLTSAGVDGEFGNADDITIYAYIVERDARVVVRSEALKLIEEGKANAAQAAAKSERKPLFDVKEARLKAAQDRQRATSVISSEPMSRPICTTDPDQRKYAK